MTMNVAGSSRRSVEPWEKTGGTPPERRLDDAASPRYLSSPPSSAVLTRPLDVLPEWNAASPQPRPGGKLADFVPLNYDRLLALVDLPNFGDVHRSMAGQPTPEASDHIEFEAINRTCEKAHAVGVMIATLRRSPEGAMILGKLQSSGPLKLLLLDAKAPNLLAPRPIRAPDAAVYVGLPKPRMQRIAPAVFPYLTKHPAMLWNHDHVASTRDSLESGACAGPEALFAGNAAAFLRRISPDAEGTELAGFHSEGAENEAESHEDRILRERFVNPVTASSGEAVTEGPFQFAGIDSGIAGTGRRKFAEVDRSAMIARLALLNEQHYLLGLARSLTHLYRNKRHDTIPDTKVRIVKEARAAQAVSDFVAAQETVLERLREPLLKASQDVLAGAAVVEHDGLRGTDEERECERIRFSQRLGWLKSGVAAFSRAYEARRRFATENELGHRLEPSPHLAAWRLRRLAQAGVDDGLAEAYSNLVAPLHRTLFEDFTRMSGEVGVTK